MLKLGDGNIGLLVRLLVDLFLAPLHQRTPPHGVKTKAETNLGEVLE
jgi:hypothetical protein